MNQLSQNQAFKIIINPTDLAETQEHLNPLINYLTHALNHLNINSHIFPLSTPKPFNTPHSPIHKLKNTIHYFTQLHSKHILQQQVTKQLPNISQAFHQ
ncbi:hypothetical protein, partial [Staphylococcus cohnii]|uniref:hypothetical protein n=1 Tax=Staphylococcus cohnii TaxID=29382 RepID=UPI001C92CE94